MNDEGEKNDKPSTIVKTVTDLAKTIPVYQDTIQPAAQEIGKTLQVVAKTVNIALAPIKALVWSYEKLEQFIGNEVSEKLQNTPDSDIQTPKANIAVPALQGLMISEDEPEMQELFANLLAAAMDKHTACYAHPAFVEAIKQMTPDEAKLMRYFTTTTHFPTITIRNEKKDGRGGFDVIRHFSLLGEKAECESPELTTISIDNLIRLGLIEIPKTYSYIDTSVYDEIINHTQTKEVLERIDGIADRKSAIVKEAINITELGRQFISVCVKDHRTHRK